MKFELTFEEFENHIQRMIDKGYLPKIIEPPIYEFDTGSAVVEEEFSFTIQNTKRG